MNDYRVIVRETVEKTLLVRAPSEDAAREIAAPDPDRPIQPGPPMRNVVNNGQRVTARRVVSLTPVEAQPRTSGGER